MRSWTGLLAALLIAGCASDTPLDPMAAAGLRQKGIQDTGAERIIVYDQNVYPGADVDAVIAALADQDQSNDLPALFTAVAQLDSNDVVARAAGIADQIKKFHPDVVGLNEITRIDVDLTPIAVDLVYHQDFLATLMDALADHGLSYEVASTVRNIEAQPNPFVSYVDYDVMLVKRRRVAVIDTFSHTFTANIGEVAPGVVLQRGWTGIHAELNGHTVAILTAHPESGEDPQIVGLRALQAQELVASVAGESQVIMLGDYNDVPGSPLYDVIADAGFTDVWPALHDSQGFTAADPYDPADLELVKRIDYVWVKGFENPQLGAMWKATLVNEEPSDRVQGPYGPIYVSDHAGLVATILQPPGLTD